MAPWSASRALIGVPHLGSVANMGPHAQSAETLTSDYSTLRTAASPGIHLVEVQGGITLADLVNLVGIQARAVPGDHMRGPGPVHHSSAQLSRRPSENWRLPICNYCTYRLPGREPRLHVSVRGRVSSGLPTRCTSNSTVGFRGCLLGHRPDSGLGEQVTSPRGQRVVTSQASELARSLGKVKTWRRNRWAATKRSPRPAALS